MVAISIAVRTASCTIYSLHFLLSETVHSSLHQAYYLVIQERRSSSHQIRVLSATAASRGSRTPRSESGALGSRWITSSAGMLLPLNLNLFLSSSQDLSISVAMSRFNPFRKNLDGEPLVSLDPAPS